MRDELKAGLSDLGPRGLGRRYPKGLLEKLLSYTVARRRQGAKLVEVATELGMHNQTLSRWVGEKRAAKRFDRVEVVAVAPTAIATSIVVHGPR